MIFFFFFFFNASYFLTWNDFTFSTVVTTSVPAARDSEAISPSVMWNQNSFSLFKTIHLLIQSHADMRLKS